MGRKQAIFKSTQHKQVYTCVLPKQAHPIVLLNSACKNFVNSQHGCLLNCLMGRSLHLSLRKSGDGGVHHEKFVYEHATTPKTCEDEWTSKF